MNRPEYIAAVVIAACRRHEAAHADDGTPNSRIAFINAEVAYLEAFTEASLDEAVAAYESLARLYPDCGYSQRGAQSMWTLYASDPQTLEAAIDHRYARIAALAAEVQP